METFRLHQINDISVIEVDFIQMQMGEKTEDEYAPEREKKNHKNQLVCNIIYTDRADIRTPYRLNFVT